MFWCAALAFSPLIYVMSYALLSRMVIYIYYNESKRQFLATCYKWNMARKNIVFKPGDVQLTPADAGILQLLRGFYRINKKPYYIFANDFLSNRHYNIMLGVIKP